MNKKSILWILLDLVFLIVFNTVFFVVGGFSHPASVWLSYAFMHFAYLMVVITPILTNKSTRAAAVFGFSLYSVSAVYFLAEFVVGLLFVLFRMESVKPALVVQIVLAGVYAVMLIANLIANESTAEQLEKQEEEVAYMKKAAGRVKLLLDKLSDKKANREVEKVYDLIHGSPTKSDPSVSSLEREINSRVSDLEYAVKENAVEDVLAATATLTALVEERNQKLKLVQ